MRLWLTRDVNSDSLGVWASGRQPELHEDRYLLPNETHGDRRTFFCGPDVPPGTCTELFTEQQMRERVSMVATKAFAIESIYCAALDYRDDPTDANWARLMAEVGGGEAKG